jgi:lipoprotein-anchoring transpeptidase ErfK/SrfK
MNRTRGTTIPIVLSRRDFMARASVLGSIFLLAGCATNTVQPRAQIDPMYRRTVVPYDSREAPGTIIVDPQNHFLYVMQQGGQALRYGVGVGAEGFGWSGTASVRSKQEWPDWYPPKEMLQRKPELRRQMTELQSGLGMRGGPDNPLGARALYLWQGNKDTLYRIHGTNEPNTIGRSVSSGCVRLTNEDVIDLYDRTTVGTKVIVLSSPAAMRS